MKNEKIYKLVIYRGTNIYLTQYYENLPLTTQYVVCVPPTT